MAFIDSEWTYVHVTVNEPDPPPGPSASPWAYVHVTVPAAAPPLPIYRWDGTGYVELEAYRWNGTMYVPVEN